MTPAANTLLPLILISLGLVKVVLSFLVPERKKASIALGLGILVVVVGVINLSSQSVQRFRWNQRMRDIQRERQADLEELQRRLKDNSTDRPQQPAQTTPAQTR